MNQNVCDAAVGKECKLRKLNSRYQKVAITESFPFAGEGHRNSKNAIPGNSRSCFRNAGAGGEKGRCQKNESRFRGFFARTRCDLVAQWLQSQIYGSSNFLVSMLAETDLRVASLAV
jgi:hypothetical protein